MATVAQLLAALSAHIGRDRGISARHLCARLNVPARRVRQLVTEAREAGHQICGHPRTGYYVARTAEELLETVEFLKDRALHSLYLASVLSQRPLLEIVGQLRLPT